MLGPTRESIWQSRVNSFIGLLFVGTCALWAATFVLRVTWGIDPLAQAFAATIQAETTVPAEMP